MTTRSVFLKRWLVHSLILWLVINIASLLQYAYQLYFQQLYHISISGSSDRVNAMQRLVSLNYYQATPVLILAVLLLVEINARAFFPKKILLFAAGSFVTGFSGSAILLAYRYLQQTHLYASVFQPSLSIAVYAFLYPVVLDFFHKKIFRTARLYEQSRAEMNALRAQVHPHFLFNTLNSLYGTAMREDAAVTAAGIAQLSSLMRYVMNETMPDFVPLSHELRFIEEYIVLQKMRLPFTKNQQPNIVIQYDEKPAMIAPLLLIPFIENSFKYSTSIERESFVSISIIITDAQLEMTIINGITQHSGGDGTGIENTKRRLTLLYPEKHHLQITTVNNEFIVKLSIQLS